jgi:hypothetical protein
MSSRQRRRRRKRVVYYESLCDHIAVENRSKYVLDSSLSSVHLEQTYRFQWVSLSLEGLLNLSGVIEGGMETEVLIYQ